MLKSKVIDVFRSLSFEELKRLREFIRSPYHNTNKNVISLFENIRKFAPLFNNENLTKEKVFKKIFPGKAYNDTVMRILLSDLMRISEDFLVQLRIEKSLYEYKNFLLQEYMDRGLDKLFIKSYNESDSYTENFGLNDAYYNYMYDIEELNKGFNIDRNLQHLNASNLVYMGKYLVIYFLIKLSSVVHDIDVNKENFNTEFEQNSVEGFKEFINPESIGKLIYDKNFKDSEILEMYYCSFMLGSSNKSDDHYIRLKELFYKNISMFERGAAYNTFLAMLNHNGKKHWDDKDNKYRNETLSLYKDMIERGIYSWAEDVYMTVIMFRSILSMCSLLKDIEWMEYFINKYTDKLEPSQRQNMFHYSHAKLSFAKKDYISALEKISKVNFNLFTFKFDVKTMMLQIYYELGYYEEAVAMMDSFKHFLNNNKNVSVSFKEWNVNFLNFYSILLNHKLGKKKTDIDLIKKKIEETPNSASPVWLKKKANELV